MGSLDRPGHGQRRSGRHRRLRDHSRRRPRCRRRQRVLRRLTKQTHSQRNPEWQSNVNGRLAPDATGKTGRPLVGASPAHTAVRRSTKSTTRTFPRYAASSPSAARSARAGSRERAAAIRARSRAQSSVRASLRCCRTSPRAGASVGIAASGPAVARAETGSGPERRRGPPARWQASRPQVQGPGGSNAHRVRPSRGDSERPRRSHPRALRSFPLGAPPSWEVHIEGVIRCRQRRASPPPSSCQEPRGSVARGSLIASSCVGGSCAVNSQTY